MARNLRVVSDNTQAPLGALAQFIPSPYQQAFFNWVSQGRGNCFMRATAGSGKTTTGIKGCALMTHRGRPEYAKFHSVAFVSFNKRIAVDIAAKLNAAGNLGYVKAGTFHSFGFKAWVKVYPDVKVDLDGGKDEQCHVAIGTPTHLQSFVNKLISFAKNDAVMAAWNLQDRAHWQHLIDHHDLDSEIEDPEEVDLAVELACRGLVWHKAEGHRIMTFDDMLWLPIVTNVKVFNHSWVIVDEAQDTNRARRLLARKMGNQWTRFVFIGDDRQAINGFTGADNDAVDQLIQEFKCEVLPLTVSYRCPQSVVAMAREYVDHIEPHESAPEGKVARVGAEEFRKEWQPHLRADDFILCRKTAPLIKLCFQLIKAGVPCHVEGREIGKGLVALAERWKVRNAQALKDRLITYREREVAKLKAKKKEAQAEALADRVECLLVLCEGCDTVACVVAKINRMFEDQDGSARKTLTLMTVHKSKGAEAPRVFILGFAEYMPSKAARQPWQMEQETNLIYVAITRSQGELYLVEALD